MVDHRPAFDAAWGSGANHQAYRGGYLDHLDELFALAAVTHRAWSHMRRLPFTLEEALLVLFLHDIEKVWRHIPLDDVPRSELHERIARESPRSVRCS